MKSFIAIAIGLTFFGLLTECKKDSSSAPVQVTTPTPPSKEELLAGTTSKDWKFTKFVANNQDMTSDMACMTDNVVTYKKDGAYTEDEGATKCDPSSAQTSTGSWSFNTDKTKLTVRDGMSSTTYSVVSISASELKLSGQEQGMTIDFTLNPK
jgi:hypothetical protein